MTQPPSKEYANPGGALLAVRPEATSKALTSLDQDQLHEGTPSLSPAPVVGDLGLTPPVKKEASRSRHPQSHHCNLSGNSSTEPSVQIPIGSDDDYCQLVARSFSPRVAVYASPDADAFAQEKGFEGGVCSLLRPFGEHVHGKVVIRDSIGGSRGWNGFGVRFIRSQIIQQAATASSVTTRVSNPHHKSFSASGQDPLAAVETLLGNCLRSGFSHSGGPRAAYDTTNECEEETISTRSPIHHEFLRRLLSSTPVVPYETFSHPVACVIIVSSHNPAPIDTLRQLYASTSRESNKVPVWVSTEYLRYYVLIHDEENDDLTKSTALFDLMRRHFGLHCHLLRLKSSSSSQHDQSCEIVPPMSWLSADEVLAHDRMKGKSPNPSDVISPNNDGAEYTRERRLSAPFISQFDANAIKNLVREMVVQSIIPFMENRVMTWNDQVASRRRGLSGRFMSLSKRWTGLGSPKTGNTASGATNSTSNYNHQEKYYLPETPEATMRQLADYAFMLKDWRLAYTTYDIVRADFGHDKAWPYHAAANEMAAVTSLLNARSSPIPYRSELVDQMLDTAIYSYLNRCAMPWGAIRCLVITIELLSSRGPICTDDTARWGRKLLELDILLPIGQVLIAGRISDSYFSRSFIGENGASRARQAVLWNLLSAGSWSKIDCKDFAKDRLCKASSLLTNLATLDLEMTSRNLGGSKDATVDAKYPPPIESHIKQQEQLSMSTLGKDISSLSDCVLTVDDVDAEGFTQQDAGHISHGFN